MMEGQVVLSLLSGLCIAIGVIALLIGSLGLLRLPDVYSRIHAVGMMDTAGAGFMILGMAIHQGLSLVTVKLLFIGVFLFFTSPIATHAVAQVAYRSGVVPLGRNLVKATNKAKPKKAMAAAKKARKPSSKAKPKGRGTS